mmetsp:Transcript_12676/g.27102  ORF Transcript_12676/g.27102 Transcript_12676/m.27102 type:complete len:99 (+) Transcript_12676:2-298(+)
MAKYKKLASELPLEKCGQADLDLYREVHEQVNTADDASNSSSREREHTTPPGLRRILDAAVKSYGALARGQRPPAMEVRERPMVPLETEAQNNSERQG